MATQSCTILCHLLLEQFFLLTVKKKKKISNYLKKKQIKIKYLIINDKFMTIKINNKIILNKTDNGCRNCNAHTKLAVIRY